MAQENQTDLVSGVSSDPNALALADTAFAYACNSRNVSTVAQQASIVFLSPAAEGDRLVAEASEMALSGRSGVYQVRVRNQSGDDIAVFQGLSRAVGGEVVSTRDA